MSAKVGGWLAAALAPSSNGGRYFFFARRFFQDRPYLVEGDADDVIDGFERHEADGETGRALRVHFGRDVAAARADRDLQVALAGRRRVHCMKNIHGDGEQFVESKNNDPFQQKNVFILIPGPFQVVTPKRPPSGVTTHRLGTPTLRSFKTTPLKN